LEGQKELEWGPENGERGGESHLCDTQKRKHLQGEIGWDVPQKPGNGSGKVIEKKKKGLQLHGKYCGEGEEKSRALVGRRGKSKRTGRSSPTATQDREAKQCRTRSRE